MWLFYLQPRTVSLLRELRRGGESRRAYCRILICSWKSGAVICLESGKQQKAIKHAPLGWGPEDCVLLSALLELQAGARTPKGAWDFDSEPHTCIASTFQALSYLPSESFRKINLCVCVWGGGSNISKIINVRGRRGIFLRKFLL